MANRTHVKQRTTKPVSHPEDLRDLDGLSPKTKAWLGQGGLLAAPLGILAIICLVYSLMHLRSIHLSFPDFLAIPSFAILLIAIFSGLFAFRFFRGYVVSKYARIIGGFFVIVGAIVLFGLAASYTSTGSCMGFFGAQTSCQDTSSIGFYLLFLNPWSLFLYEFLSILGVIILLTGRHKYK